VAEQALYRKWRPVAFDEVVGQEHVVKTIRNALASGRAAHAYLFSGPRGTGKTTTARLVAKALNCAHPDPAQRPDNTCSNCLAVNEGRFLDLIEIDAASNTGVDNIRDLRDKINFSPSEGQYKVYVIDECFRYEDLVTLADGSKLPIGKIVEENLQIEVLSYNEQTQQIEPKPVIRRMRKTPVLPTVKITFDNNRVVVCTINHKFYTPNGQQHAGSLEIGQFVNAAYERITEHQLSVVTGAAIGDGHLSLTRSGMRARLSITQGVAQKSYLEYKAQLLGDLVKTEPAYQLAPNSYSRKGTYRLATLSRPQIAELHRKLYDSSGRKRISCEYLNLITPLGLALWYLDDGSLVTQANPHTRKDGTVTHYPATRSTLSIYSLTREEAHLILDWLREKLGVKGGVTATSKGPVIWLTLDGTEKLHELIAPYVPPDMAYKLLPAYRNHFCPPVDEGILGGLAVSVVRNIEWVSQPKNVYNLEVADNHNYFVRDILVANCHMLSMGAFNALLKTLEEPPPHAIFILATTELHKVPLTVASRCQKHAFRRIPAAEVAGRLQAIVERENLQVEPAVLDVLARQATGSLRDAISLLDQLIISPDEKVTLDGTLKVLGTASGQAVQELAEALLAQDSARGLDLINTMADNGIDPRQFGRQMVDYLRGLLLMRLGNAALVDVGAETRKTMQGQATRFDPGSLVRAIKAFNTAANDSRSGWLAQLPLELAFVECLRIGLTGDGVAPAPVTVAAAPRKATAPLPPLPTPAATSAKAKPASEVSLSQVTARWTDIVSASGRSQHNLPALLQWCKPMNLESEVLVLGFQNEVLLSKTNTDQNLQLIEAAIQQVLGQPLKVRCIINSAQTDALPDVSSDGPVAEAIRLGGKLRK